MAEKSHLLPAQLKVYQEQAQMFLDRTLDIDQVGREVRQNTKAAYFFDQPHDTALFHFEPIPVSFGVIRNGGCGKSLCPNTIRDLIEFSLRECVQREIPVRRCRSCGRYFPITGRVTEEQFATWHKTTKTRKKDCDREVISLDEFKAWLKDS